jgi:quinolinate synthase
MKMENSFKHENEQKILAIMACPESRLESILELIHSYYFTTELNMNIAEAFISLYNRYNVIPTEFEMVQQIKKFLSTKDFYDLNKYVDEIHNMYNRKLPDKFDCITHDVAVFIQNQEMRNALHNDAKLGDILKAKEIVKTVDKLNK